MIRINLLPFRAARARENIKRQISIYGLVVLFTVGIIGYVFIQKSGELSGLKAKESEIQAELGKFQRTLNEIKILAKKIKEVEAKLSVIKKLEEGKSGPVLLLADISTAIPREKLWLTSLTESGSSLSLSGTAMNNATVADFMKNLEASDRISSVELGSAKLRDLNKFRLKVSDFSIRCKIVTPEKEEQEPEKGKKKRR